MKQVDPLAGVKKKVRKKSVIAISVFFTGIVFLNVLSTFLGNYGFIVFPIGLVLFYIAVVKIYKTDKELVCPECGKPILMESKYPVMGALQYPEMCYFCRASFERKEQVDG